MRPVLALLAALVPVVLGAAPSLAQAPAIPPGYTAYTIAGPGVNAPPLPFRIEGDRLLAPEESMVTIQESQLSEDRAQITMEGPGIVVRFIGVRRGDEFSGFGFITGEGERDFVPLTITPANREPTIEPDPAVFASGEGVSRIEVVPGDATIDAGEERRFVARVFDAAGNEIAGPAVEWYAGGSRSQIDSAGVFRALGSGPKQVVAMVGGSFGLAEVSVAEPRLVSLTVHTEVPSRLAVGSRVPLEVDALNAVHRWELDPAVMVVSSDPGVVAVADGVLTAVAPGWATVTLTADSARAEYPIEVVAAPAGRFAIEGVPTSAVRAGDVVRLSTTVAAAQPVWSVTGAGAQVDPDGAFVAESPGRYVVVATLGDRVATAAIEARARGLSGRIRMQGHGLNVGTHTSDLWPQNAYVYVGTHQANQLRTYDVSDPSSPVLADSQLFDARVVNDVKVSADGQWLVATREGAADRRNGILVFSLSDPAHPALVSEYTETLTAGVHNVFWEGSLVYAVNDGTGDMHIIDLSDPAAPREVGRWGLPVVGRALHDVWVQEGVAYLSYLGDGLVILDVGGAGQGGTPTRPVLVSRLFYPGGPTHSAYRYGDYVFVGDEDFSLAGTVPSAIGSDPRGPVHVVDVSDLARPRYVGRYEVPEAGAHNFWVDEEAGILYIGYYQGGIRAVDVTGELRGNLYRQGREIAHFLPAAAPEEAKQPFSPRVWGVFPMFSNGWRPTGEVLYATDYNSGLWSFTVELPEEPIS